VDAATNVTGTLPIANGGTGATTLRAATIATLGYTTTATAAGTTTLTATSTATQFFTGSTTQTVVLPVASTMTQGQQFTIHNNSSGALTINSSGPNLVATVNANTTATITCILTSGTDAASWDADFTGFTTALSTPRGGTGLTAIGTANQVLAVNAGATALEFQTLATSSFPAGTRMSFQQTAAPTGWTKDTTAAINDSLLRLVTGTVTTGGSTGFSTWAAQTATGATTLDTTQIPSHTHSYQSQGFADADLRGLAVISAYAGLIASSATGGGGSHTHSLTQSIKYYDFIIAAKD
jgi:hypothetical protein